MTCDFSCISVNLETLWFWAKVHAVTCDFFLLLNEWLLQGKSCVVAIVLR